jgi:hypothetical protein
MSGLSKVTAFFNKRTLVVCYYNIAVEESNLANPDVAVMNYEEAYKVAHEYFGEEDVLT